MSKKHLILCADDYGISPGVNAAILDLAQQQKLSAVSCMTLSRHMTRQDADWLKKLHPHLAIGLHVTLTYLPPLTQAFPAMTEKELFKKSWLRRLDRNVIENEIIRQFEQFIALFGFAPDFIDGHQHIHALPVIRDIILQCRARFAPQSWMRDICNPFGAEKLHKTEKKRLIVSVLGWFFQQQLRHKKILHNNGIYGFYDYTRKHDFAALFTQWVHTAPDHALIYVHPGFPDAALEEFDTVLTPRQCEYDLFHNTDLQTAFPDIKFVTAPALS